MRFAKIELQKEVKKRRAAAIWFLPTASHRRSPPTRLRGTRLCLYHRRMTFSWGSVTVRKLAHHVEVAIATEDPNAIEVTDRALIILPSVEALTELRDALSRQIEES